jgi:hypothetical protein
MYRTALLGDMASDYVSKATNFAHTWVPAGESLSESEVFSEQTLGS